MKVCFTSGKPRRAPSAEAIEGCAEHLRSLRDLAAARGVPFEDLLAPDLTQLICDLEEAQVKVGVEAQIVVRDRDVFFLMSDGTEVRLVAEGRPLVDAWTSRARA